MQLNLPGFEPEIIEAPESGVDWDLRKQHWEAIWASDSIINRLNYWKGTTYAHPSRSFGYPFIWKPLIQLIKEENA